MNQVCRTIFIHLLILLGNLLAFRIRPISLYFIGIVLDDVPLNWLKYFLFSRLIDCVIPLSKFQEIKKASVLSFFPRTATLWNALNGLSLELICIFHLGQNIQKWISEICGRQPLKNLKAVIFHKFHLVHSWIFCSISGLFFMNFPIYFSSLGSISCNSISGSGGLALYVMNPIKKQNKEQSIQHYIITLI